MVQDNTHTAGPYIIRCTHQGVCPRCDQFPVLAPAAGGDGPPAPEPHPGPRHRGPRHGVRHQPLHPAVGLGQEVDQRLSVLLPELNRALSQIYSIATMNQDSLKAFGQLEAIIMVVKC